jgi:hypothetical protein
MQASTQPADVCGATPRQLAIAHVVQTAVMLADTASCRSELLVTMAPITLRAAFSNIRTWNILQADIQLAGQVRRQRVSSFAACRKRTFAFLSALVGIHEPIATHCL